MYKQCLVSGIGKKKDGVYIDWDVVIKTIKTKKSVQMHQLKILKYFVSVTPIELNIMMIGNFYYFENKEKKRQIQKKNTFRIHSICISIKK